MQGAVVAGRWPLIHFLHGDTNTLKQ
jgi:hypothetical protein